MNFSLFQELFGSFNYQVPTDKQQLMYDFYMLSMLYGRISHKYQKLNQTISGPIAPEQDFTDMDHDDKIDYMINEVANKLLPAIKKELLDVVYFAITSEMMNVFSKKDANFDDLSSNHKEIFQKYSRSYGLRKDQETMDDRERIHPPKNIDPSPDAIFAKNASYAAAMKSASPFEFVQFAKSIFSLPVWNHRFGGEAWAAIADAWMHLYQADSIKEMMIYIDHIYDIQHNTGTVFNKSASYKKREVGYDWIKKALNHKANIKSPFELIPHVSPGMKKIAIPAIKSKFGISLERHLSQSK